MSLKQKILRRIEDEANRGDPDSIENWSEKLAQLVRLEKELDENGGDVTLSIRDLIRAAIRRKKRQGKKFRPGDIANEIANQHKLDRNQVRQLVMEMLGSEFDVTETDNKWLTFEE